MYSLYKKGYMPNGRLVTVTGHLASFKSAYLDANGMPKILKRAALHLTKAQVFDGGFGPGPAKAEVETKGSTPKVDPTPAIS
jgi:hypothetical protein